MVRPQVHDEVILEGPKATSKEAQALVQKHMANPWRDLIDKAIAEGRRGADPYSIHPRRTVDKDNGEEPLVAPVEPLLVRRGRRGGGRYLSCL